MRIDIITAVPELLHSPLNHSILKRAADKGLVKIFLHDLRNYGLGKFKQIDDYQFGGGAGMVLMPEPLGNCIEELKQSRSYDEIIYLSPDGRTLDQKTANTLSLKGSLLLICGHYKGIDQRIRDLYVTAEISIGDFVLTGGELAAAMLCDAVIRLLPGVLGNEESALSDTFQDGLLAAPIYTRPAEYKGLKVPDVLLQGDHKKIEQWREEKAEQKTNDIRPDLLEE